MFQTDIILLITRLVAGGIIAFLAILLWSKTRKPAWMCLVSGAVLSYASVVFDLLVRLGIVTAEHFESLGFGIGVSEVQIALTCVNSFLIILAFIMLLVDANRES